ncbi:MAG: VTT domain-containing protein [Desulfovibrio sp.]|nr:VTT domain-containing protein [Desulfovibrio sp.]
MSSPILKICVFFLILAGASLLVHLLDISEVLDPAFADAYLKHRGGVAIYVALVALLTPLGFPRQALAALGGYAFGVLDGTGITLAGLGFGCAAGFFYARLLARPALIRRFGEKIRPLDKFLSRSPFATTVAIRCLPIGNNALTNMIAGVTSIPAPPFIAGSILGYAPQTLIFALLGSGLRVDLLWRVGVAALLFIASTAIGIVIYRRCRDEIKDALSDPKKST